MGDVIINVGREVKKKVRKPGVPRVRELRDPFGFEGFGGDPLGIQGGNPLGMGDPFGGSPLRKERQKDFKQPRKAKTNQKLEFSPEAKLLGQGFKLAGKGIAKTGKFVGRAVKAGFKKAKKDKKTLMELEMERRKG